jgi:hypothetical protein
MGQPFLEQDYIRVLIQVKKTRKFEVFKEEQEIVSIE